MKTAIPSAPPLRWRAGAVRPHAERVVRLAFPFGELAARWRHLARPRSLLAAGMPELAAERMTHAFLGRWSVPLSDGRHVLVEARSSWP